MSYSPDQPAGPSDYERLLFVAQALYELTPSTAPEQIIRVYKDYQATFFEVITGADDVAAYQQAYIILSHHAATVEALRTGTTTLDNLKHVVEQSLQLIP